LASIHAKTKTKASVALTKAESSRGAGEQEKKFTNRLAFSFSASLCPLLHVPVGQAVA